MWKCELCDCEFSRSSVWHRHKRTKHSTEKPFICELCSQNFSRKDNLLRHIHIQHQSNEKTLTQMCELCGKQFKLKSVLKHHISAVHREGSISRRKEKVKLPYTKNSFLCDLCGAKFTQKYTLRRHISSKHAEETCAAENLFPNGEKCFICATCNHSFYRKDSLRTHILKKHMINQDEPSFQCALCLKVLKSKNGIKMHIHKYHNDWSPVSVQALKCLECGATFPARYFLTTHYGVEHGIALEYEQFEFDSGDAFERWKADWQRRTVTQFRVRTSYQNKWALQKLFICHRSGYYTRNASVRRTRRIGSKRLQGICPAEISLRVQNGKYYVRMQKTHVGHRIFDQLELCFMTSVREDDERGAGTATAAAERCAVVAVAASAVARSETRSRAHDAASTAAGTVDDGGTRTFGNDAVFGSRSQPVILCASATATNATTTAVAAAAAAAAAARVTAASKIESLVAQNRSAVVFFKDRSVADDSRRLGADDFLLVLVDAQQERRLRQNGRSKIISAAGTREITPPGFVTHILFVSDDEGGGDGSSGECIPAAVAVANCDERTAVDIFFECVRDRVGVVETRTMITNTRQIYHESWNRLMKPATYRLYCQWHVHKTWSRHRIAKIADPNRRAEVKHTLNNLLHETDAAVFENALNRFLTEKVDRVGGGGDDDVGEFVDYFRTAFGGERKRAWATCYRRNGSGGDARAVVNTNAQHVEAFCAALERNSGADEKDEAALYASVRRILAYLNDANGGIGSRHRLEKRPIRLDEADENHRKAERHVTEKDYVLQAVGGGTWQVQSLRKVAHGICEVYVIEEVANVDCGRRRPNEPRPNDCRLRCAKCDVCFHEYRCTCPRSSIKNSMCKHVHMLGLTPIRRRKRSQQPSSDEKLSTEEVSSLAEEPPPPPPSSSPLAYINSSVDRATMTENLGICSEANRAENSVPPEEENEKENSSVQAIIEAMVSDIREAGELAVDWKDLCEIRNKFIKPIKPLLLARKRDSEEKR